MRKAAIYARFSTDLQNERSIEDEVALCRFYAEREQLDAPCMRGRSIQLSLACEA